MAAEGDVWGVVGEVAGDATGEADGGGAAAVGDVAGDDDPVVAAGDVADCTGEEVVVVVVAWEAFAPAMGDLGVAVVGVVAAFEVLILASASVRSS